MGDSTPTAATTPRFAVDALPARPEAVQLRARRNPRLIALGVLLACLGGLGAAYLYLAVSQANSVLLVTKPLQRGEVLTADHLGVVSIGHVPGVSTVPGDQLSVLVGKSALVDLPAGSLLGAGTVGVPEVAPGFAQVGLKLDPGRAPVSKVPAGTPVKLIEISDSGAAQPVVFTATLVNQPMLLPDGQTTMVDVLVAAKDAPRVAVLAANDKLVLVRETEG